MRGTYPVVTASQNPNHKPAAHLQTDQTRTAAGVPNREQPDDVAEFVRCHQTAVTRFLRLCGAGARAEELAQEAFLVAIRRGMTREPKARAQAFSAADPNGVTVDAAIERLTPAPYAS